MCVMCDIGRSSTTPQGETRTPITSPIRRPFHDYARDLMKGCYSSPLLVKKRESILKYPGAEKAVTALGRVFGRRIEIGASLCQIVGELYRDSCYEEMDVFRREFHEEMVKPLQLENVEPVKGASGRRERLLWSRRRLTRKRKWR